jgi:O-antigen/teichoic acid export membrane protein
MQRLNFLSKHRAFVGNVATVMSGKTIAAGIALITTPIVARLYAPTDFGVAAAFLSLSGMITNVAALRYEGAIILPKEEDTAIQLVSLAYRILAAVCLLMVAFLVVYKLFDFSWSVLELVGVWMWLLPLAVLLGSAINIQESWLTRNKNFRVAAGSTIAGTGVNAGTRIGLGTILGSTPLGLIFGNIFGTLSRFIIQKSFSYRKTMVALTGVSWSSSWQAGKKYSDFPRLNAPAGLVFSLGQNLPVILFGILFSPVVAGLYAMANRLSQAPLTIVAMSTRRVFMQKAATIENSGRSLRKAFLLTSGGLAALGAVPFTILFFVGQPVLTWILGDRWFDAGGYLEIMAPWLFMIWVAAPAHSIFIVLRKQDYWLYVQVGITFIRLAAFGLAFVSQFSPEETLSAFVLATVLVNFGTILLAMILILNHDSRRGDLVTPDQEVSNDD